MRHLVFAIAFASCFVANSMMAAEKNEPESFSNLSGWNGIVFSCESNASPEIGKVLCGDATANAVLLATTAKVNFETAEDLHMADIRSIQDDLLSLHVKVGTVGEKANVISYYASVTAQPFYPNAVVQRVGNNMKGRTIPRPGYLVLWQKDLIGHRLNKPVVRSVVGQSITDLLEQFFLDYTRAESVPAMKKTD